MVNTEKTVWMHENLATATTQKRIINIPEAGDHIIGNPIRSKDVASVKQNIQAFTQEILHLNPSN